MTGFNYEKDSDNIVTITMDMPGQSVNTMNQSYEDYMETTVARLEKERDDIAGVIIASAKDTFFAGGDLTQLVQISADRIEEFMISANKIKGQLRRLETLGKPVVAAINGAALGGGYEICLACHYRVAIDNPKSQIGLPEAQLGLLPGGGGVARLPRVIGLQDAIPFLTQGSKVKPAKALEMKLIEALATDRDDMMAKAKTWIKANPDAVQPWDVKGFKIPGGGPSSPKLAQLLQIAPAMMFQQTKGLMPAPQAILSAAVEGCQVDIDNALMIETRYFLKLALSPVAKNMISTFFFQMNELNAGGSRPKGIEKKAIKKVGVLGAGMMGAGIAYQAARSGIQVVLKDISVEAAEKGKAYSTKILDKAISRGRSTEEKKQAHLDLILATDKAEDLAGCDLVIEAVFEEVALKAVVTKEAEVHLDEGAIFASNTSTLPITTLAEASRDSSKFIGLHFFSPVDKMPLVEIICGENTSDETLAAAFDFVLQIRKTPIVVNDVLQFFTSRVFGKFLDEGAELLESGVDPVLIDNLSMAIGMPVGPLAQQDEVSQQLAFKVMKANRKLLEERGEDLPVSAGERVIGKICGELGREGKAYNGGFYDYPESGSKTVWPELRKLYHKPDVSISHDDIKDRILFRQVIESIKCLEENVLRTVRDGNIGSIFGIGAPPWTGGFLQFVNTYGVDNFIARSKELAELYGDRFNPPKLLLDKAAKGELFVD
jgi:3-hydroxyacyl-CoA dehydrogenase/enoyl-CoA hydratase/3-hydroxybutyryl-CoA epimerase